MIENEGFPESRVHVIPNGVDTRRFQPPVDAQATRRDLGIPLAAPVVGILAALRPEKNHELFLTAARRVTAEVPEARFVVIGDGPRRGPLEQLAEQLEIADRVHFLGNRSDVPEVLGAIDVLALTSHNEANPVSILEAMSVGTPVVATDVGSVSESVDHFVTGFLTRPGDETELAERLIELLDEPLKARAMGDRGRRVVERCWSLESMVTGYERLLDQLYTEQTGRARPEAAGQPPVEAPAPVAVG